jgi:hypothetical protein
MHKDGTVQTEPLTWIMAIDCDWTNGKHRQWFYYFVSALDQVIKDFREYYQLPPNPSQAESYDYALLNPPHDVKDRVAESFLFFVMKKRKLSAQCWFPYPRFYAGLTGEGRIFFTFARHVSGQTLVDRKSRKLILIKFTHRYERAVHELLAENDLALTLYGCEDVLEGLEWMMVAMEYIPLTDWVPLASKTRSQH